MPCQSCSLAARGESPAAFDWRCGRKFPNLSGGVTPRSQIPQFAPSSRLAQAGRGIVTTRSRCNAGFHHGLLARPGVNQLEKGVDQRPCRRARQHDERAHQQEYHDHRRQPPLLAGRDELPQLREQPRPRRDGLSGEIVTPFTSAATRSQDVPSQCSILPPVGPLYPDRPDSTSDPITAWPPDDGGCEETRDSVSGWSATSQCAHGTIPSVKRKSAIARPANREPAAFQ